VLVYVKVFVIGAVMREPMNQTEITAAVAGSGLQPRFEEQDRASQISARLIRNGQSHHAMRVESPARFFSCNYSVSGPHYSTSPWRLSSAQAEVYTKGQ
jgi:hypothetical protein